MSSISQILTLFKGCESVDQDVIKTSLVYASNNKASQIWVLMKTKLLKSKVNLIQHISIGDTTLALVPTIKDVELVDDMILVFCGDQPIAVPTDYDVPTLGDMREHLQSIVKNDRKVLFWWDDTEDIWIVAVHKRWISNVSLADKRVDIRVSGEKIALYYVSELDQVELYQPAKIKFRNGLAEVCDENTFILSNYRFQLNGTNYWLDKWKSCNLTKDQRCQILHKAAQRGMLHGFESRDVLEYWCFNIDRWQWECHGKTLKFDEMYEMSADYMERNRDFDDLIKEFQPK